MADLRYVGVKERSFLNLVRVYVDSARGARRNRALFGDVRKFCLFIGYPRSGHSIVGSLLDAHRQAVIAHELDVLAFLNKGFSRAQLFYMLLRNSAQFTEEGREWTDYKYTVPGQWQGRCESIRVIGDKKGGRSVRRLNAEPALLDRLRTIVEVPIKFVHVVRNPWDNISTRVRRNPSFDLGRAIKRHFYQVELVAKLKARLDPEDVLDLRHEDVIQGAEEVLRRLCGFLDLDCPPEYLEACSGIIFKSPRNSRQQIDWPAELIDDVRERMEPYLFLSSYTFED